MYPPQRSGIRATTVHDLVPLHFPHWVTSRTYEMHRVKYEHAVRTCDLIVTNSRYTAGDVIETLGVAPVRVRVAHPSVGRAFTADGERADLGRPYVLALTARDPRKNLDRAAAGFQLLRRGRPDLWLAIAGVGPVPTGAEHVLSMGYVSDVELARLYRGALAFTYPSRFEGFGLPIVEAMASGCPVVASSHPSLHEASGDCALRVDPDDDRAFAEALAHAIERPSILIERGLHHARRFTAENFGGAVLAAYEEVLAAHTR
jgi:glycosyltransferase involved in cell wall biosynthesis